jgi:hypothetical protein
LKSNVGAFLDFDTTNKALLAILVVHRRVRHLAVHRRLDRRFEDDAVSPSGARKSSWRASWLAYILLKIVFGLLYSAFMG